MQLSLLLVILCFMHQAQGATTPSVQTTGPSTAAASTAVAMTTNSTGDMTTNSTGNSSTFADMTTPTPTMGDNSSMTGNMSEVTSPPTNGTMNDNSTLGNETSTMSAYNGTSTVASTISVTQAPTTMAPTTAPSTAYPSRPYDMNMAVFKLELTIGDGGKITSACNASEVKEVVESSFRGMPGYLYTVTNEMSGMTSVHVYYRAQTLLQTPNGTANATMDALKRLNMSDCFNLTSGFVNQTSAEFAALSMMACRAEGVCPVGYSCQAGAMGGCQHLCAPENCSAHGTCYLNLTSQGAVTACSCGREGMYYYGGDKCEIQMLHPDVIIAIIAGILGSVCFILFVILLVICICRAKASTSKYEMNGHFNEGYQEHSLSKL